MSDPLTPDPSSGAAPSPGNAPEARVGVVSAPPPGAPLPLDAIAPPPPGVAPQGATAPPPQRRLAPLSDRFRLARLVLEAALGEGGVAAPNEGPLRTRFTAEAGERLPGVTAVAAPGGGYAVSLHLDAHFVPLHPLADAIRGQVTQTVAAAGLDHELAQLDINFEDLAEPAPAPDAAAADPAPPPADAPPEQVV